MSIVKTAIDKSRALARRTGDMGAKRNEVGRAKQAAAIDPEVRIRPASAALDPEVCRQRRLLLNSADEKDLALVSAYRMLRTRLLHRARAQNWSTIALTSAGQNDGKTLTSLNLAISLARDKSRDIVLLDLDMRNPSVYRTLGLRPTHEIKRYLETGEGGRDMFVSVFSDNLLICGSYSPTDQASELLASSRFDDLLQLVKLGTVDPIILIDLPPVLLTDDALVVAPKVDALLVVTSEGFTPKAGLLKALDLLADFPLAGVVVNRATDVQPGYGYGYEYGSELDGPKAAKEI